jgi:hypothetical protein
MQMLALLWFESQFAQQYFGEVFWRSKVAAKTRDSTSASSVESNSLNREISQGLSESDQIITSPPPDLADGLVVNVPGNEMEVE